MTQLAEKKEVTPSHYRNSFSQVEPGESFVRALRHRGIERFDEVGFPNTHQEAWRLTSVAAIAKLPFELADRDALSTVTDDIATRWSFGPDAAAELILVNGYFDVRRSRQTGLPRGVIACNLSVALQRHADLIEPHLARHAQIDANPFVALNTGFLSDGVFIHIPRGVVVEKPIHLMFISTPGAKPTVSHPRVLVVLEENAQATIVESYAGGEGVYWTNAVTEIVAGQHARIDHCKLQQESMQAYHVSTTHASLGRESNFVSHSATLGAALTRNDLNVIMAGQRAEATVNGLVILTGRQHADNHTLLDHSQPNCPSHELYKHVLADQSSAVFNGKILVRQPAQKTDSKQTSKSLLLSDLATMNSQPALEIYADDVKCTHGSTTGPVDEEMVFYLRSRGVGADAARHLLSYAFAADITRRIRVPAVRQRLEDFLAAQHGLPSDLRITDLGDHNERAR
jgi:Fe-S cluster assembly protein SufD